MVEIKINFSFLFSLNWTKRKWGETRWKNIRSQEDYYHDDYSYYGKDEDDEEGRRKKRRTSRITVFVICMVLFIFVFMPYYGITLRYYIGTSFRLVFDYLGRVFQTVGGFTLVIVVGKLFIGKKIWVGGMVGALLLLWMGAFLTGGTIEIMGMTLYQPTNTPGFH